MLKLKQDRECLDVMVFLDRVGHGGVSRVACIVAEGCARAGLRTKVVARDAGIARQGLLSDDVQLTLLADPGPSGRPGRVRIAQALAEQVRRDRPRVLLSPGNQTNPLVALAHLLAGTGRQTALVVKLTNPISKQRRKKLKHWYRHQLHRWIFSRAAAILVLSPERGQLLAKQFSGSAAKLRFVHNPCVTSGMVPLPASASGSEGTDVPEILAIGRLTEQKNLLMLLRAAASLRHLPWRISILGTGPDEQRLRDLAAELGIADRTVFQGYVSDPIAYMQRARLLALPSRWEDLPAVVLEAMACGCPVVATACADSLVSIIKEAAYGRLVPVGGEAAFAAALAEMLTDPPPRRRPSMVDAYTIDNGITDHLQAFRPWLTQA